MMFAYIYKCTCVNQVEFIEAKNCVTRWHLHRWMKSQAFYYWWALRVMCAVWRPMTLQTTTNFIIYDGLKRYKLWIFFSVTSSHFLKRLCSVMNSMLLNRWIDHDDSFWTSLTCFVTFDFFYRRRASSFSSRCSCFSIVLTHFFVHDIEHSSVSSKMKSLI